jgi:hypothetical protein
MTTALTSMNSITNNLSNYIVNLESTLKKGHPWFSASATVFTAVFAAFLAASCIAGIALFLLSYFKVNFLLLNI